LQRRLAISGWILYLTSWVIPSWSEGRVGARAFLATLQYAARLLFHPSSALQFVLGLCLLLGWLANFSILVPLTARTRLAWIVAPWLPFLGVLLLMDAPLSVRERVFAELYFYPWAIGIAAIHLAMIWRERRQQATGAA
jgi:hypothetical protein